MLRGRTDFDLLGNVFVVVIEGLRRAEGLEESVRGGRAGHEHFVSAKGSNLDSVVSNSSRASRDEYLRARIEGLRSARESK